MNQVKTIGEKNRLVSDLNIKNEKNLSKITFFVLKSYDTNIVNGHSFDIIIYEMNLHLPFLLEQFYI